MMAQKKRKKIWKYGVIVVIFVGMAAVVWHFATLEPATIPMPEMAQVDAQSTHKIPTHTQQRKKVGLALGSGGARGLAHIGVIKVLEEHNIPIDYIAGTSMGAVIGALYATTKNVTYMEHVAQGLTPQTQLALIDMNVGNGLVRGEKITNYIGTLIDNKSFAQTQIPFAVVAADIATGKEVVFTDGAIAPAVRASASIPFVFEPYAYDDKIFIDGGTLNPVPVNVVRAMGADIVIAIDLDTDATQTMTVEQVQDLRAYSTTARAFDMMRSRLAQAQTQYAEITIIPQTQKTLWYDFGNTQALIDAGEEAARARITEITAHVTSTPEMPEQEKKTE